MKLVANRQPSIRSEFTSPAEGEILIVKPKKSANMTIQPYFESLAAAASQWACNMA